MAKKEKHLSKPKAIYEYELPERLKYLRELRNLTQVEFSRKSKISQSAIAQIETGRKDPSIATLKKLAYALDIPIALLFATDDIHVFDMKRLRTKYDHVDKLNPTLYFALGKVVQYARDIGFIK